MSGERRVLLADDEPAVRTVLGQLLEALGFEVVAEAADGDEAVELYARTGPTHVLIDLRMPGLDGIEATRRICRAGGSPHVVVMSAYPDEALQEAAREAGAAAYVIKGGPVEQLVDALQGG